MHQEKETHKIRWFSHNNIKFRTIKIDEEMSIIWATILEVDLCFTLMLYDFLDKFLENFHIDIKIDSSWKGRRGFIVKNGEVDLLLREIANFVSEWEIESNENGDKLPDEEWYSI